MGTVTVEAGKWKDLVFDLEDAVKENKAKPKGERITQTQLFKEFAEQHNTTAHSASYYYYHVIRKGLAGENKPTVKAKKKKKAKEKAPEPTSAISKEREAKIPEPPVKSLDESINDYSKEKVDDPRSVYKIGDIVDIEIISLVDFGAFGRTEEGFEGLIHISQITREYVTLAEDYFYIGEKVRAKIVRFDGEKLSFSLKELGGKNKLNPVFKDLANKVPVKEGQPKDSVPTPVPATPNDMTHYQVERDREQIIEFIKKYSDNKISPQALHDIEDLLKDYGVFQTTMSLMETVRDLDISSFITNLAKDRLEGERLRQ